MSQDHLSVRPDINSGSTVSGIKKLVRSPEPRCCSFCKGEFIPNFKKGPKPKFCSRQCKATFNTVTKVCENCGEPFQYVIDSIVDEAKRPRRYCTLTCKMK